MEVLNAQGWSGIRAGSHVYGKVLIARLVKGKEWEEGQGHNIGELIGNGV